RRSIVFKLSSIGPHKLACLWLSTGVKLKTSLVSLVVGIVKFISTLLN
ncbi:MAG: hypothetical protein ACI9F1_002308, partial [Colwellia sp.]